MVNFALQLAILAENDKRLARADELLEQDIRGIRQMMLDGFGDARRMSDVQKEQLDRIEDGALKSVPEGVANQIALHTLIWQVAGVTFAVAAGIYGIIAVSH